MQPYTKAAARCFMLCFYPLWWRSGYKVGMFLKSKTWVS